MLASVSRLTDLCLIIVKFPYDSQTLYVGLEVRMTSVDVAANFQGLKLKAAVCIEPLVENWLSGCLKELHGFESFELLVACPRAVFIALFHVFGVAGCVCCTSCEQVTLSRALAEATFFTRFFEPSRRFALFARRVSSVLRSRNLSARNCGIFLLWLLGDLIGFLGRKLAVSLYMLAEQFVASCARCGFSRSSHFAAKYLALRHMLQEFGLTKRIDDAKLSTELGLDDDCPKYRSYITGGDLDRRLELCDAELVVSVFALSIVLCLARGFL